MLFIAAKMNDNSFIIVRRPYRTMDTDVVARCSATPINIAKSILYMDITTYRKEATDEDKD